MDEKTVTMMEGVAREWRVRVMDSAGNVLNPEGFSFYGAAADGMQVARRMQVRVEGDVVVMVLPGLWMSGRCWRYQVLCQNVLTGVEWVLCQGDVVLERRVACNGPALHEDAVLVDAVLDSELEQVEVFLGDSTAATAEAARRAVQAAQDSLSAKYDAVQAVEKVTAQMERAETAAGKAEKQAENAETHMQTAAAHAKAAQGSELAAAGYKSAAAGEVTKAAGEVEKAKLERETAAGYANAAARSAQSAMASQQAAEQARQDAQTAKSGAEQAAANSDASKSAAQNAESNAKASASQAAADKVAAEQAKTDAQAAQSTAEEHAAIATKAAADAQAPESIAAQAARPATMLLVKDELMSILGDASLYDLDADGQKIIVHTDRLSDDKLAAVTDMLERFVPQFIEVVQYNHNMEISWREVVVHVPPTEVNKYDHCTTVNEIAALNPDYKSDLTSDGGWGYALFNLKYGSIDGTINWSTSGMFMNSPVRIFGLRVLPKLETAVNFFAKSKLEELELELPLATNIGALWAINTVGICAMCAELMRAVLIIPKASIIRAAFYRCPKLESLTLKGTNATDLTNLCYDDKRLSRFWINSPKIDSAENAFFNCLLDKESILHILQKLATYTDGAEHLIALGIHVDHKYDPEVNLALKMADINYEPTVELPEEVTEGKGWTLAVQWNDPSTAQSASTFAMGALVYAKVGEMENSDGTIEKYLDWGHYVTNWEERGYEQFRSLESAYRYFNLPEPEETLTETE